jgi:uncharacterized protein (TIGR02231 family)
MMSGVCEVAAAPPVDTGIALVYPLPGRYTVRSGEPEKKLLVFEKQLNAEFEYFIMPKITEHAYSTGTFSNKTEHLFLAGDGNTYVGDDFTGSTYIETIVPDEKATISFGVDDRVKVERKTKKHKVVKAGLVKKVKKYEFAYENTITNYHKKAISCRVVDQVPVAEHPDIRIGEINIDPQPTKQEKDRGIYHWEITIPAGKKYVINTSFSVEVPYGAQVEGLMI